MAIFLRAQGIPARIVEGYLPGTRAAGPGADPRRLAPPVGRGLLPGLRLGHVRSDRRRVGPTAAAARPGRGGTPPLPSAAFAIPSCRDPRDQEPNDIGRGAEDAGSAHRPFIAIAILLAVIVGALAFVAWQRGPRGGTTADHAYRTVTRLASRFGFGPRPNQTVYEYSGALGEVLPIARPELEMVARAKVETAYGRFRLEDDRIQALRAAERKLRLNLLRLAFRRRERRRRR